MTTSLSAVDPLLGSNLTIGGLGLRVVAPAPTEGRAATYRVDVDGGGPGFLKLARDVAPQSELVPGLENEARVLARLDLEGVPRLLGAGAFGRDAEPVSQGGFALVTRWVRGTPMSRWEGAEPAAARRALVTLGVTLARVHGAGFVHADVRPGNVLVDVDRDATTLVDFDAAVAIGARQPAFVGAPRFASPEQRDGAPLAPASDVFAFAVTARRVLGASHVACDATLDEILARAEDHDASRRPSLEALCDALARSA